MMKQVKSTDVGIVMGDLNTKIGEGRQQDVVGDFSLRNRNE